MLFLDSNINIPHVDVTHSPTDDLSSFPPLLFAQADNVFSDDASQEEVYRRVAEPIEDDVIAGFSCVIFAYGQTGTGKTHTMEGNLEKGNPMAGIIPRMCESLFDKLVLQQSNFTLKVTAVELYCDDYVVLVRPREKKNP